MSFGQMLERQNQKEMSEKTRFVLSNGKTKNSYGFRVRVSGIGLERFKANPVMLSEHNYGFVLGKWEAIDLDTSKEQLLASPLFDSEDSEAAKIEGKVERGFINGASVGLSFNSDDFKMIDGELILTKSELIEVSICAIPSDCTALKLYYAEGEKLLSDEEVGKLCLSFAQKENLNKNKMDKTMITLSSVAVAALGLDGSRAEFESREVENAVLAMGKEKEALKVSNEAYKAKEEKAQAVQCFILVEDALKAGKITADKKDVFLKMAKADYQLVKDMLDTIPAKQLYGKGLCGRLTGSELSLEDFCKMELSAQLEWKEGNPEMYAKMVAIKQ